MESIKGDLDLDNKGDLKHPPQLKYIKKIKKIVWGEGGEWRGDERVNDGG